MQIIEIQKAVISTATVYHLTSAYSLPCFIHLCFLFGHNMTASKQDRNFRSQEQEAKH